jgi:hypothetical protein
MFMRLVLVGVIVGGIITAGSSFVLAVRRERADRERDSRALAIEVKRAARLIDMELARVQAVATYAIDKRSWHDQNLSTEAWQKYGALIAPILSNEAWRDVLVAIAAAEYTEASRDEHQSGVLRDIPIPDDSAELITPKLEHVKRGREALAPLVWGVLPVG